MNTVEVVIVGGGIAGLATALALQKVGVKGLVLERANKLRYEGAAISLFPNAWRALKALDVLHKIEPLYQPFQIGQVTNLAAGTTQQTHLGNGVMGLHRKVLIDGLAEELPPDCIRFSSKLVSIKNKELNDSSNATHIELEDGTVIQAKILIGCEGVHSVVAKWLGLSTPIHSGRGAFRALSVFPQGHGFKHEVTLMTKMSIRAGYIPISDTDVFWFITHNITKKENELGRYWDPKEIQREALENQAKDLPSEFIRVIHNTDLSTLSWGPLLLRRPWDLIIGATHRGAVAVAGDAFHPMTPDLGQGGGSALEDAVVLARNVSRVLDDDKILTAKKAERAIEGYVRERKWRVSGLIAGAYLSGWVQQGGGEGVVSGWFAKWFRDNLFFRNGFMALHRKVLIDALAEELPPDCIRFSSKLVSIKNKELNDSSNATHIELEDGTVIQAKMLIGCEGVHSVVAKWLGLSTPIHSGRGAFRALSVFPQGHGFKHEDTLMTKMGIRAGYIPISDTDVFWFITHNITKKENELGRYGDPEEVQQDVLENQAKDLPSEFIRVIHNTDLSTLSWGPLLLRRPWDLIIGATHRGAVAVAGDALHPMTPELGQGGGSALEDAVVLARNVSRVLNDGNILTANKAERAIEGYVRERKWRVSGMIVGSYLSGWVQQGGGAGVVSGWFAKWFRDHLFFRFVQPRLTAVVDYDCGRLE